MKIKHKVVKEFQYLSPDKKIFILKVGTILQDYTFNIKSEQIPIDTDIINNNPEFFELIDWKIELVSFMKSEKIPQPAQMGKKLIPFFEELVMSSIQHNSKLSDPNLLKEIEKKNYELNLLKLEIDNKESELSYREIRIKSMEDELEIRNKRLEKREDEYKLDLKNIEIKNNEFRSKNRELIEKEILINEKEQEVMERERNLDKRSLISSIEFDQTQKEIQDKINKDIERLSIKEKELESEQKRLRELEVKMESNINKLIEENKTKIYDDLENELIGIESDIRNIYKLANDLKDFNHPFVEKITKELILEVNKLKNRIDNNIMN